MRDDARGGEKRLRRLVWQSKEELHGDTQPDGNVQPQRMRAGRKHANQDELQKENMPGGHLVFG